MAWQVSWLVYPAIQPYEWPHHEDPKWIFLQLS